jgi:hypothetical protein
MGMERHPGKKMTTKRKVSRGEIKEIANVMK